VWVRSIAYERRRRPSHAGLIVVGESMLEKGLDTAISGAAPSSAVGTLLCGKRGDSSIAPDLAVSLRRRLRRHGRASTETVSREGLLEFYDPRDGRGIGAQDFAWFALALELLDPSIVNAGVPA
jgi:hypothetical protein